MASGICDYCGQLTQSAYKCEGCGARSVKRALSRVNAPLDAENTPLSGHGFWNSQHIYGREKAGFVFVVTLLCWGLLGVIGLHSYYLRRKTMFQIALTLVGILVLLGALALATGAQEGGLLDTLGLITFTSILVVWFLDGAFLAFRGIRFLSFYELTMRPEPGSIARS